jgi:hypothetical protein
MGTEDSFLCFLVALHCYKLLILLAPEVGLEPTTLRLTAMELVGSTTTIGCYKLLPDMHLDPPSLLRITIHTCPIMTDFERAWVQKWVQPFGLHVW